MRESPMETVARWEDPMERADPIVKADPTEKTDPTGKEETTVRESLTETETAVMRTGPMETGLIITVGRTIAGLMETRLTAAGQTAVVPMETETGPMETGLMETEPIITDPMETGLTQASPMGTDPMETGLTQVSLIAEDPIRTGMNPERTEGPAEMTATLTSPEAMTAAPISPAAILPAAIMETLTAIDKSRREGQKRGNKKPLWQKRISEKKSKI